MKTHHQISGSLSIACALAMVAGAVSPAAAQFVRISVGPNGEQLISGVDDPKISDDGTIIVYSVYDDGIIDPADMDEQSEIYIYDTSTNTHTAIDLSSLIQSDGFIDADAISGDGNIVALYVNVCDPSFNCFTSYYVFDRAAGTFTLATPTIDGQPVNGFIDDGQLSYDGRYFVYSSNASNLVAGDTVDSTDIYVFDRQLGVTTMVSVNPDGTPGNQSSNYPSISNDGQFIAFSSYASGLVTGDTNELSDIFVRDMTLSTTRRVTQLVTDDGTIESNGESFEPVISGDGSTVAFYSTANNLTGAPRGGFAGRLYVTRLSEGTIRDITPLHPQGLPLCYLDSFVMTTDGSAMSAEVTFCDDFNRSTATHSRPSREDRTAAARGGDGFYDDQLILIDTSTGGFYETDVTDSGIDADAYDHDFAPAAGVITFESTEPLVSGDTNEGEDVYVGSVCSEPEISRQPLSDTEVAGTPTIFTVEAGGRGRIVFQWFRDGEPLEDDDRISGANSSMLVINPVGPDDQGVYTVIAGNACAQLESGEATLRVVAGDACPGDVEPNRMLDFRDVTYILRNWGECPR